MADYWKGSHYENSRLLILGESQYSWREEEGTVHPSENHARDLVEWAIAGEKKAFMNTICKALTLSSKPRKDEIAAALNRIAFTNYVGGSVGAGAGCRPSPAMWERAKERFSKVLLPELRPKFIIVLGLEMWSKMPSAQLHITKDVQAYVHPDGSRTMCWAVAHPTGAREHRVTWQRLAAIVHFSCGDAFSDISLDKTLDYDHYFCRRTDKTGEQAA